MMKKVILSILAVLIVGVANAQKVEKDETFSNGSRVISTSLKRIGYINNKFVLWIGLSVIAQNGSVTYSIETEYTGRNPIQCRDNAFLVFETTEGAYVETTTQITPAIQTTWHSMPVMETVGSSQFTTEHLRKSYPISITDLAKLMDQGVSKVKIQLNVDNDFTHEKDFKKDEIGKVLAKCMESVKKALYKEK